VPPVASLTHEALGTTQLRTATGRRHDLACAARGRFDALRVRTRVMGSSFLRRGVLTEVMGHAGAHDEALCQRLPALARHPFNRALGL
jgi:hypothetical protein